MTAWEHNDRAHACLPAPQKKYAGIVSNEKLQRTAPVAEHPCAPIPHRSGNKRGATQIGAPSAKPAAGCSDTDPLWSGRAIGDAGLDRRRQLCLRCEQHERVDRAYCAECREAVRQWLEAVGMWIEERA